MNPTEARLRHLFGLREPPRDNIDSIRRLHELNSRLKKHRFDTISSETKRLQVLIYSLGFISVLTLSAYNGKKIQIFGSTLTTEWPTFTILAFVNVALLISFWININIDGILTKSERLRIAEISAEFSGKQNLEIAARYALLHYRTIVFNKISEYYVELSNWLDGRLNINVSAWRHSDAPGLLRQDFVNGLAATAEFRSVFENYRQRSERLLIEIENDFETAKTDFKPPNPGEDPFLYSLNYLENSRLGEWWNAKNNLISSELKELEEVTSLDTTIEIKEISSFMKSLQRSRLIETLPPTILSVAATSVLIYRGVLSLL